MLQPRTRVDSHGKRVAVPNDERLYDKYDTFLIKKLTVMNDRMRGWAAVWPMCFEGDIQKEKLQPSEWVNRALDRLGGVVRRQIIGSRGSWTLFISALAWIYHEEVSEDKKNEIAL